jgi:hypothetical protein
MFDTKVAVMQLTDAHIPRLYVDEAMNHNYER